MNANGMAYHLSALCRHTVDCATTRSVAISVAATSDIQVTDTSKELDVQVSRRVPGYLRD